MLSMAHRHHQNKNDRNPEDIIGVEKGYEAIVLMNHKWHKAIPGDLRKMMMAHALNLVLKITQHSLFAYAISEHQMIMVLKKEGDKTVGFLKKIEMQLLEGLKRYFSQQKFCNHHKNQSGNTTVKAMNLVGTFQFHRIYNTRLLARILSGHSYPEGFKDPYEAFLAHLVEKNEYTSIANYKHGSSPVNVEVSNDWILDTSQLMGH